MEDSRIIELYFERSEQAIAETASKYGNYCTVIARNILYSQEDAEECVNDTWLNAWNAIPPTRPSRLAAFLGKITRNLALNLYERFHAKKRGEGQTALALDELAECVADSSTVEAEVELRELAGAINGFLAGLPAETRRIFVLRYWYLYPVREIAERLGRGESMIKMNLLRTRNQLKEYLEREGIAI